MVYRASWKGFLKVGQLICPIALYTAASTTERIALHRINRRTGHRLQRALVDAETGDPVEREAQIKGYEVAPGEHLALEPDEVAATVPASDKTLAVEAFIRCSTIDHLYFDRPYYLAPADRQGREAYVLLRDGLRAKAVAAMAEAVLFRRVRKLLIRADGAGLIATTLNFDYEVRESLAELDDLPAIKLEAEMLALAQHIIETKSGRFEPARFHDRYEAALAELVKAKLEGKPLPKPKRVEPEKVVDLMAALRKSAKLDERKPAAASKARAKAGSAGKGRAAGKAAPAKRRKAS
jgi:DNA end-binding protein Ku